MLQAGGVFPPIGQVAPEREVAQHGGGVNAHRALRHVATATTTTSKRRAGRICGIERLHGSPPTRPTRAGPAIASGVSRAARRVPRRSGWSAARVSLLVAAD